ncbi:MAG: sigma-54-dependent Fis family transcriptional regulator, partial [Deltaproteobacteria bacterium]|nr:sigma-54-dependent Fis family transcriptional regulator [Deltaproteobacteria bacterium]
LQKIKAGIFELANGGTLFLDEIGEASPDLQVKLLKVIEEGKFTRLGGQTVIHAKFKLICATNRDLKQMVASGRFREDLYMRIATFPIRVPNLQERKEDIPEIIKAILPKVCTDNKVYISYRDIPRECIDHICKNPIPGNIRGLDHLFSRLLVHATKDKKGKPIWDNWRDILDGTNDSTGVVRKQNGVDGAITLQQLINAPLDVMSSDFPGLREILDVITNRIFLAAMSKHKRNKEIAKVLRLSESVVSVKIRGLQSTQNKNKDFTFQGEVLQ